MTIIHCINFSIGITQTPHLRAIIMMGKKELLALLNLSSWCLVIVEWLFLAVPWGLSAVCDCGIS